MDTFFSFNIHVLNHPFIQQIFIAYYRKCGGFEDLNTLQKCKNA